MIVTAKKTAAPDPWLTPAQMIAELGISKRTWARMRAAGTAPKCVVPVPRRLKCRRSPVVIIPNGAMPDPDVLRAALRKKLNQGANAAEPGEDEERALTWIA